MSRIVAIALVYKNNAFSGFRIMDIDNLSGKAADVTKESVVKALNNGTEILNIKIENAKFKGVHMKIKDLPIVNIDVPSSDPKHVNKPTAKLYVEHTDRNTFSLAQVNGSLVQVPENLFEMYKADLVNSEPIINSFVEQTESKMFEAHEARDEAHKLGNLGKDELEARVDQEAKQKAYEQLEEENKNLEIEQRNQQLRDSILGIKSADAREELLSEFTSIDSTNTIQSEFGTVVIAKSMLSEDIIKPSIANKYIEEYADEKTGLDINQKLIRVIECLKKYAPFYYSMYRHVDVVYTLDPRTAETACASVDAVYLNLKFVQNMSPAEILFLILHELSHIALGHHARGKGKNHALFNIAGDLYINKMLADEFKCPPSAGLVKINDKDRCGICIVDGGLYSDHIDVNHDTVEIIYNELCEAAKEAAKQNQQGQGQQSQQGQGQGQGQQSQQGQGQGQGQQSQQGQGQGQGQQGQGQHSQQGQGQGQGQGSSGESGSDSNANGSQGNGSNKQGGDGKSKSYHDGYNDGYSKGIQDAINHNNCSGDSNSSDSEYNNGYSEGYEAGLQDGENLSSTSTIDTEAGKVNIGDVTFRGTKIGDHLGKDLVGDSNSVGRTKEELEQASNRIIIQASQAAKLAGAHSNAVFDRYLKIVNAPKVKWSHYLTKYLINKKAKVNSFITPDRRFINRNQYIPGPKKADPDALEGIKFCVDTSGSVDEVQLYTAFSQAATILKKYDASGEIIYWDTAVRSTGQFKDMKDLQKSEAKGGGGTDINCVFDYMSTLKGKDMPKLIIVFTDGYFGKLYENYANKYGSKIIWVINKSDLPEFKSPCGKVAVYDD